MGGAASRRRRSSVFPSGPPSARASIITRSSMTSERGGGEAEVGEAADIKPHLCGADPITSRGKQIQMIQMLTIPMVPALLLLIHSTLYLSYTVGIQTNVTMTATQVTTVGQLAGIVHTMQEERLAFILYTLNNDTAMWNSELVQKINHTYRFLQDLNPWPALLTTSNFTHESLRSRSAIQYALDEIQDSVYHLKMSPEEILAFYTPIISSAIAMVDELIRGISTGSIWKLLVAQNSLIKCQETLGSFTVLGYMISDLPLILYWKFIAGDVIAADYIRKAKLMSPTINSLHAALPANLTNPTPSSQVVKLQIEGAFAGTLQGRNWLKMTNFYISTLRTIEKSAEEDIVKVARDERKSADSNVAGAMTLLVLTLVLTPVIFGFLHKMVNAVQSYVHGLYKKGVQIRREKKKSDDLLYQMLPKSVALQLKVMKRSTPESFRLVTIFFSDIVGFTALSSRSSPLQVVDCLNKMYNLFDSTIAKYDVFKVETIGDAYMVASGVPQRNGMRHAGEIAMLSLDLVEGIHTFRIPHRPDEKLRVRVGIHTGSVVAGVVGAKMPRYCLFGDTVSYASLMESLGVAMKVQMSPATNAILTQLGTYLVDSRGVIDVTGYGESETFFLRGRVRTIETRRA